MSNTIRKKLYSKMKLEYDRFIESLQEKTFDDLIDSSYQIIIKREILEMFYPSNNYNIDKILALYSLKKPLEELYQEWMAYDVGINYVLELCFDDFLDKLEEEYISKKKNLER